MGGGGKVQNGERPIAKGELTFERAPGLSLADAAVENKAFDKILSSEKEILAANKAKHGNVVNTDDFHPYFADVK